MSNFNKDNTKKIVICILGGTTSQIAAFYRGYVISKLTGRKLILDISSYSNGYHFPYALDYFNINYDKIDFCHEGTDYTLKEILSKKYLEEVNPQVIECKFEMSLDELIDEVRKYEDEEVIHIIGEGCYFQKKEYFDEFRQIFTKENIENNDEEHGIIGYKTIFLDDFKQEIKDKISIGVFARRTEYVSLGWADDYVYYKAGIDYFTKQFPNAIFYIFSDDLDDVKKNLGNQDNFKYVKFIGGADAHIEALLALSYCSHTIVGKTGWGTTISLLCQHKDAQQLRSGEKNDPNISYTKYLLDKEYLNNFILEQNNKVMLNLEVTRKKDVQAEIQKILDCIQQDNIEQAQKILVNLCFDTYYVTQEQRDVITNLFEYICVNTGEFLRAEQSLGEHLYANPESLQINMNMARVKAIRCLNLEACMYATKTVRLAEKTGQLELLEEVSSDMLELFEDDYYKEIFKYLSSTQKIHFVIAPLIGNAFFSSHKDALVVWLTRMGHKVSILSEEILLADLSKQDKKIDLLHRYIPLKSDSNISKYTVIKDNRVKENSFDKLPMKDLINAIFDKSDLPGVFINRNINLDVNMSDRVPMIYWDFSCDGDKEKHLLEHHIKDINNLTMDNIDKFMCKYKPAVITTDKSKVDFYKQIGASNIFVYNKYTRDSYEILDFKLDFEQTVISDERFLGFVVQVVETADRLLKQDIINVRKNEIRKLGYESHALQLNQIPANSKVLEFGCNVGHITRIMKYVLNCDVSIIEYGQDAYNQAKEYAVDGMCGDAEELKWLEKFKGQEFDIILFGDVLEHLRRPDIVLENCKKLLKDGGKIVLSVPNNCCTAVMALQYLNIYDYLPTGLLDATHIHLFSYHSLCNMIKNCDLDIEIQDAMCLNAFNTEFANAVKSLPKPVFDIFENRPMSNVYQFVFTLVKPNPNYPTRTINRIQERCDAIRGERPVRL